MEQDEPFRLNLEEVFSLDHATRELRKEHVTRLTEETDPTNVTLRIRCTSLIFCLMSVTLNKNMDHSGACAEPLSTPHQNSIFCSFVLVA